MVLDGLEPEILAIIVSGVGHLENGRHPKIYPKIYPKIFIRACPNCVPNVMLVSKKAQFTQISAGL